MMIYRKGFKWKCIKFTTWFEKHDFYVQINDCDHRQDIVLIDDSGTKYQLDHKHENFQLLMVKEESTEEVELTEKEVLIKTILAIPLDEWVVGSRSVNIGTPESFLYRKGKVERKRGGTHWELSLVLKESSLRIIKKTEMQREQVIYNKDDLKLHFRDLFAKAAEGNKKKRNNFFKEINNYINKTDEKETK